MKARQKSPKAKILKQFATGDLSVKDLKAHQLGFGDEGLHFMIKGYEDKGCIPLVQIDQITTLDGKEVLVPCEDAIFYEGEGLIIVAGQIKPDLDQIENAERKPSLYARFSVIEELGTRLPSGSGPTKEEEELRDQEADRKVFKERERLRNILK